MTTAQACGALASLGTPPSAAAARAPHPSGAQPRRQRAQAARSAITFHHTVHRRAPPFNVLQRRGQHLLRRPLLNVLGQLSARGLRVVPSRASAYLGRRCCLDHRRRLDGLLHRTAPA
jgi:hypothetical protein